MQMNINAQPLECTLYFTDVCNFSCAGCSRQTVGKPKHLEMSIDMVDKIMSTYPSIQSFCIAGLGEPTIAKQFPEVIDHLIDNGKYVGIITNATYPERLLQLKNKPSYISISLYGFNKEEYKSWTKVDAFEKVKENYKILRQKFSDVGFSYILNKENYKKLDAILKLCDELQPAFLNLVNYLAYDSVETEDTRKIISLHDTEIIKYIEERCDSRKYVKVRPTYVDETNEEYSCYSYGRVINVDGQGNIGGCQRQITPSIVYGNFNMEEDPFNSVPMQILRKGINSDTYPHFNCKSCFGRFNPKEIRNKVFEITGSQDADVAIQILFHEKVDQTIECLKSFIPSGKKIYILNNDSSKESTAALKKFCKPYPHVKIFDSDKNLGVGIGRNYLLQHTHEEWVLFVDNDIYVTDNKWYEKFLVHLRENPEMEVFIPKLFNLHENSFVTYHNLAVDKGSIGYYVPENGKLNNFPGGASIIKRSLFQRLGLYDDQMFVGLEDFEFVLRGILSNAPVKAILVNDIELVHDHRKIEKKEDKKAVLIRYDENHIQKSFDRMQAKYPEMNVQHEWRGWVKEQKIKLMEFDKYDLSSLTPEYNFGVRAKCRNIVEKNSKAKPYDSDGRRDRIY